MRRNEGLAFHVHHDILVEYCYGYKERVYVIKTDKPEKELKLRLKLFKLIPIRRLPGRGSEAKKTYSEAAKAYFAAEKACSEAKKAYFAAKKTYSEAAKAYKAYFEAKKTYSEAGKACSATEKAYLAAFIDDFKVLHAELCPDCPWDGKTIFPAM